VIAGHTALVAPFAPFDSLDAIAPSRTDELRPVLSSFMVKSRRRR
jgi:hypothetical protein